MKHPASPENEDTRLHESNGSIARRCACRGWIVGPEAPQTESAGIVVRHQLDEPHKSWDLETWVERNTAKVDVPLAVLRKVG